MCQFKVNDIQILYFYGDAYYLLNYYTNYCTYIKFIKFTH